MNDLLIFVSYAVPRKRFYFFSFTRYFPNSFCQKCHNFSKQISLSYKNRLFFFHKIIHIITSQWYNLFVKVNSKAVLKVNIVRETEMWSLAPYSSTPPPTPPHPPTCTGTTPPKAFDELGETHYPPPSPCVFWTPSFAYSGWGQILNPETQIQILLVSRRLWLVFPTPLKIKRINRPPPPKKKTLETTPAKQMKKIKVTTV